MVAHLVHDRPVQRPDTGRQPMLCLKFRQLHILGQQRSKTLKVGFYYAVGPRNAGKPAPARAGGPLECGAYGF